MRRVLVVTIICLVLAAVSAILYFGFRSKTVTLSAEPSAARPGETVTITLTNDTDETVGWGYPYTLHRRFADGWIKVPLEGGFPLPLLALAPGETAVTNEIDQPLDPGIYRVVKSVSIPLTNRDEIILSTTFRVD